MSAALRNHPGCRENDPSPLADFAHDHSEGSRADYRKAAGRDPREERAVRRHPDFEDVHRGLVASIDAPVIGGDGKVVWDNATYAFLTGDSPESVNPSLWRQSQLVSVGGLFEVAEGIYQVRGMDLSNTSFVEGDEGVVVIDTLLSAETGAAALALYRKHRGDRPIKAVVYTHSHADHFGGVKGFVSQEEVDSGAVRIFAPEGFTEHAVSENV